MQRIVMIGVIVTAAVVVSVAAQESAVAYPDGYRFWNHVKSMVLQEGHPLYDSFGGIHHICANEQALTGYREGAFPDGAILVFDLLEAVDSEDSISEGSRKVLGVMHKDGQRFRGTGGWGFEAFEGGDPEKRVVESNAETACFQCHTSQSEQDYVFSTLRD